MPVTPVTFGRRHVLLWYAHLSEPVVFMHADLVKHAREDGPIDSLIRMPGETTSLRQIALDCIESDEIAFHGGDGRYY